MRSSEEAGRAVASQAYNKHQPRATGPFELLQLHNKTLVMDNYGIPEMTSIDCVTHASMTSFTAPSPSNMQQEEKFSQHHLENSANGETEYVADHIVTHTEKTGVIYVVSRYISSP